MKMLIVTLILCMFASPLIAKDSLTGNWDTGNENTIVKISKKNGIFVGEILSSDNPKAKTGKVIIKFLKKKNDIWEGKVYVPKNEEWYDAEMTIENGTMEINVSVGFFSKTRKWKKVKSNNE
jgi:uncharacterized protein (DUF2147 family)